MDANTEPDGGEPWRGADEGWGRRAVDFATLMEPSNCREYVSLHQHVAVGPGDRLLDIACGAGLALELAQARGARCAGIDASERLAAVATDRCPDADIHVGDMHALPWADGAFDVVTSFRGIFGTTPDVLAEVHRVLAPGGRLGLTVSGHIKASPGVWAFVPFTWADEPKVARQAAMVALGRPGAGEALLTSFGFETVQRIQIPFALEFADPEEYARALASTGPSYEAIQAIGEAAFMQRAIDLAAERVREGLPLRALLDVVGYTARKPVAAHPEATFLGAATPSAAAQELFDGDVKGLGYVMNSSRVWAHQAEALEQLSDLLGHVVRAGSLTMRQRGILISACASGMGDAYCSLAWGGKLAKEAGNDVAVSVLRGDDDGLDPSERALARWARQVSRDPNATTTADVESLRQAGFDDAQIVAITAFVGLRIAFSAVNDALGARPDRELSDSLPAEVRDAVTWGRPVAGPG